MQVLDAVDELLEEAAGLERFQTAAGRHDQTKNIAAGTVLHHLAVGGGGFGNWKEVEGLDDVGMAEGGRNAELGGEAFDVSLGGFTTAFTEFLKSMRIDIVELSIQCGEIVRNKAYVTANSCVEIDQKSST